MIFILNSGRRITLEGLRQWKTYEGLMAGIPDKGANDRIVGHILKTAAKSAVPGCKPFLVPPQTTVGRKRPGFVEEWLPAIVCVGTFESGELPGSGDPYSLLTVVWFQDEFGPPNTEDVPARIRQIDWESVARPLAHAVNL